ncbi:MAG: hypothetical protein MZV70_33860 [Desulfobacterales bacterium]|nr:hypothetical protein [Desulfobacterales bacterium]
MREVREESLIERPRVRAGASPRRSTGPYSRGKVACYYIAHDPHRASHAARQSLSSAGPSTANSAGSTSTRRCELVSPRVRAGAALGGAGDEPGDRDRDRGS